MANDSIMADVATPMTIEVSVSACTVGRVMWGEGALVKIGAPPPVR